MLAPAVRQKMEAVFRQRFNDVRVHVQPLPKPQFAGAAALTQGSHIYFAPGCYNPLTSEGERILAHELAHVVQQRSGRVRNPSGSGVAVVRNTVLDAEAERMAGDAATFQPRTAQRIAGHRARASIQCAFILTATYTPTTDDVQARIEWDPWVVKLEKGKKYYVKGFNFKGESLLYDELFGIDYWVPTKNDGQFCRIAGLSDRTAGQWERQIFKNGCWLAAVAVLGGKTQRDIQQSLGWSDDAFYAIVMEKEMAEFGQMCGTELTTINYMSADAIYNAVDGRKPVMLGVPGHVVVIYAMSADKQQVSVWDPDGAKLKPWTMDDVKKFGKLAFIAKNHRL